MKMDRRRKKFRPQSIFRSTAVVQNFHCAETLVPLSRYNCTKAVADFWYKNRGSAISAGR